MRKKELYYKKRKALKRRMLIRKIEHTISSEKFQNILFWTMMTVLTIGFYLLMIYLSLFN